MSNIYLNEFDRFIKHELKPLAYMRYGDDWLCFMPSKVSALELRRSAIQKLDQLSLSINPKIDRIEQSRKGVSYLGVDIWPQGRRLQASIRKRIIERLDKSNVSSYRALIAAHERSKWLKTMDWQLLDLP